MALTNLLSLHFLNIPFELRARFQMLPYKKYAISVIILYMSTAYIIPWIVLSSFAWENPLYIQSSVGLEEWSFPFLVVIFSIFYFQQSPSKKNIYDIKPIKSSYILIILIFIFIINLYSSILGFSNYRYSNLSISQYNSPILYLTIVAEGILDFIVFSFLFFPSLLFGKMSAQRKKICYFIIGGSLLLTNTGIASGLRIAITTIFIIWEKNARAILFQDFSFYDKKKKSVFRKGFKLRKIFFIILLFCVSLPLLYYGFVFGLTVKTGMSLSEAIYWTKSTYPSLLDFFQYLVFRTSSDYYSLKFSLANYAYSINLNVIWDHFLEPVRNAIFRFDTLLGKPFDYDRPELGSLGRINVLMIANYAVGAREGTSTGPIPGFLYSFPFPINFMFFFMYLVSLMNFFQMIFKVINKPISFIGILIFAYSMRMVFMSPIDILLVFDTLPLYLLCFIVMRFFYVKKTSSSMAS
jgi:hypothetical protein